MDKTIITELNNLRENLYNSLDYKVYKEIEDQRLIFSMYKINYSTFLKTLDNYYKKVSFMENSLRRRFQQKILIKDIHNLLFSSRIYLERFGNNEDINDNFYCFIKELRNFITHYSFLPLSSRDSLSKNGKLRFESIIFDDFKEYLMKRTEKYKNRKGLHNALLYLENRKSDLNLNLIFEEYNLKLIEKYKTTLLNKVSVNNNQIRKLIFDSKSLNSKLQEIDKAHLMIISDSEYRYINFLLAKAKSK